MKGYESLSALFGHLLWLMDRYYDQIVFVLFALEISALFYIFISDFLIPVVDLFRKVYFCFVGLFHLHTDPRDPGSRNVDSTAEKRNVPQTGKGRSRKRSDGKK